MSRPPTPALLLASAASLSLLAGCETMADVANDSAYEAALTGAAEVPGPGDPDGMGNAEVTFDWVSGNMC
ncbi:MAG: CHRD domain-containing protein, partial [Sphingomonadales bacterium]|nr:CHRD domain-containing protein [Sphingomonadales bacterium]